MRNRTRVFLLILLLVGLLAPSAASAQDERAVYVLTVDDAITSATADYIRRGIGVAEQAGAQATIIQLNTPGGDLQSTVRIMEALENAALPVIVHVWPRGGMAASAGTLILLAAHGAAMAPRTTIGAAHPVTIGTEEAVDPAEIEKVVNVLVEHAGLFAQRRGEAALDWAERAIRESATANPELALELGVIDLIADDLDDLLDGFDQRTLLLGDGTQVTLHTAGAEVREVPMSLVEQLLSILINPNVAFLLLTIGVQAILIEISAPGGWAAGFIGVLCLALAAYAFGILPFNWLGLLLIGIAFVLFVLDIKAPTHGALTAAGAGTFIAGGLIMFNAPAASPYGRLSVPLVVAVSVAIALFFAFVIAKALRAQRPRPTTGKEGLTGRVGVVKVRLDPTGSVLVAGERWQATSDEGPIEVGERVEVVAVQGFRLHVRREA